MKYCQYCGAKLEDGQQCTCQAAQQVAARQAAAAQQPAARPAAPVQQPAARPAVISPKQHPLVQKTVLNQQQKSETQRTMMQAGESAKTVGKGMQNPAGAHGASFAGPAQNKPPKRAAAQGKRGAGLFRVLMMVFGALHILFFFILSYAKLDNRGNMLKSVAQLIGIDVPSRLTALNLIRLMKGCAELGVRNADAAFIVFSVLFGLPVLFGLLLIVINCVKKSGGMIGSIVLSALTLVCYLIAYPDMSANAENLGYEVGLGIVLVAVVVVLQIVVAVIGHIAGRKALANARSMQTVNTSRVSAAEVPVSAMYPSVPSASASYVPTTPVTQAPQAAPAPVSYAPAAPVTQAPQAAPAPASYIPAVPESQTPQTAPVPAAPAPAEYTPAPSAPAVSVPQASQAPSRNLFCRNCGARLLGDSKFCTSCGAPVDPDPNEYGQ